MERKKRYILALFFLTPLLLLMTYEMVYRGGISGVFVYPLNHPIEFGINYVLLASLLGIFYFLGRKIYLLVSFAIGLLMIVFAFASSVKLQLRGVPIVPADLYLGKEAANISQYLNNIWSFELIAAGLTLAILLFLLIKMPRERKIYPEERMRKITMSELSLVVLLMIVAGVMPMEKAFGVQLNTFSQMENTEQNGVALAFLLNAQNPEVKEVRNYSKENIQEILEFSKNTNPVDSNFNPNVILILSEALWDPTLLKGVEFNKDPIPYFRELTQSHSSGTIVDPVYGGGTINSEIEVLTGASTEFVSAGASLHKYVDHPVDSLASLLKNQGYNSSAIHTFNGWFYERNRFYKEIGFDKFYSLEFFNDIEYHGLFAKDTVLFNQVLKEMKGTEGQDFIYAPTVEGHGPYEAEQELEGEIQVTSEMSDASKNILTDYANRINGFDKALKQLIEGVEDTNEPTIVAVYGDHLPMLGEGESVYREFGYFDGEETYEDYIKKYSTSLLVWDNFSNQKEELRMSSSFLSPYLLKLAKKEGSYVTDYLTRLQEQGKTVFTKEKFWDKEKLNKKEIRAYQNIQYDSFFGENYAYGIGTKKAPDANDDYLLGNGPIQVEYAGPTKIQSKQKDLVKIELAGSEFVVGNKVSTTVVSINGDVAESVTIEKEKIQFDLPKKYYEQPGTIEIKVLLKDNTQKIISDSNVIQLTVE